MYNKNICIVSDCQQVLGVGGTETVSYLLKQEFINNGYNVWSFYLNPKTFQTERDIEFPEKEDICSIENKRVFIETITKNHIEVIISQGAPYKDLLDLCIEAKKATKAKLIYCYHFNPLKASREYDDYKERFLQNRHFLLRPLYSFYFEIKRNSFINNDISFFKKIEIGAIDTFVSLNKKFTDFLQTLYPQQFKERFHTIVNPIILDDCTQTTNKENIILFVGRLTYQKRLDRLLVIWKELQDEFKNWKVIIVGEGNYANEYKTLAKELQLRNVEFVGQQPSEEFYKRSKIVCMTSSHESFGMVLVEAQKFGCAPIAYNSFETATDIIENWHNGVLIEPYKKKELIAVLKKLMTDDDNIKRLADNGHEYIKKFDSKIIIKDWLNLIKSLE